MMRRGMTTAALTVALLVGFVVLMTYPLASMVAIAAGFALTLFVTAEFECDVIGCGMPVPWWKGVLCDFHRREEHTCNDEID